MKDEVFFNGILYDLCCLYLSSNDEEDVSVILVVGMGGLRKTTVAQLVYNDENIKSNFDHKAWVCISDNFDVELTIRKIIYIRFS